jgi:hypothetical protein
MTSKVYNLRVRMGAGISTQSRARPDPIYPSNTSSPVRVVPPHLVDVSPVTGATAALYSDVVAARPPSPGRDTSSTSTRGRNSEVEPSRVTSRPEDRVVSNNDIEKSIEHNTTSEEHDLPQDPEGACWTTVKRRRARSLGSLERGQKNYSGSASNGKLTTAQAQAVKVAAGYLTESQKRTIQRRQERVSNHRDNSFSSRGEGPARPKGKTIDPKEWGNVNISQESLNIEAQAAALESLEQGKRKERLRIDKFAKN